MQKKCEFLLDIKLELINMTKIMEERRNFEKEKELENEAYKIYQKREKEKKEAELERLRILEIEG
jgi:hypothetical protein